jgi:hypothetical protein
MALDPTLAEVLNDWLDSRMGDLHVAMPGKVTAYDRATQTAEVEPQIQQALLKPDGGRENIALPKIPNVRVLWPRAGGAYLHMPMAVGNYVLLVFNEAAIALWRETGEVSPAGDLERHGLSYPYAIPGGWPDAGAFDLPSQPSESYTDSVLMVPGVLRVVKSSSPDDQFVALANLVMERLNAIQAAFDAHVHPTGVGPSGPPPSPIGPLADVASVALKAE